METPLLVRNLVVASFDLDIGQQGSEEVCGKEIYSEHGVDDDMDE